MPTSPIHFDLALEAGLIASVLRDPKHLTTAQEAGVTASTFVGHADGGTVWSAIEAADVIDPVTVAAWLDEHHPRDVRWQVPISAWITSPDYTSANAPKYAELLVGMQRERWLDTELKSLLNGQRPRAREKMDEIAAVIDGWATTTTEDSLVTDLQPISDGEGDAIIPNVATRDDHQTCLLYGPGLNWLSSEPGLGKSNLGFWWCKQEMEKGNRVMYFDYEMNGHGVVARMKAMGVDDYSNMSYVRRSGPWSIAEMGAVKALIKELQPTLVVFDAVAGAMDCEGMDPESNTDVERWVGNLPTYAVHMGAAVLCDDHVTKSRDNRGRYPIGAQRKLARCDAAFSLEMDELAGVGVTGRGTLNVMKDRWGALSPFTAGECVANVVITSGYDEDTDHYDLAVSLLPPAGVQGQKNAIGRGERWDAYKYQRGVCETLRDHGGELGSEALKAAMGKSRGAIDKACLWLSRNGYIDRVKGEGNLKPWRLIKMYDLPATPDQAPAAPRSFYDRDEF